MLEMGQDEGGAGDIADLAGAGSDPLEGRQRPLSSAKPRSPRHRTERSSILRVRALMLRGGRPQRCLAGM